MSRTVEQARSLWALEFVRGTATQSELAAEARRLPAMLRTQGLGQTIAWLKAGKGAVHRGMLDILERWLTHPGDPAKGIPPGPYHGSVDLIHSIADSDPQPYRRAMVECESLSFWIKKLAEAELGGTGT